MLMEKRTPHYPLAGIKRAVDDRRYRFTRVALEGGAMLGFDVQGMLAVVRELSPSDFYKSMTTYRDHTVWQDVYRPHTAVGQVYLKLTLLEDVLIVSFKEK